jgi:hypothetical protein
LELVRFGAVSGVHGKLNYYLLFKRSAASTGHAELPNLFERNQHPLQRVQSVHLGVRQAFKTSWVYRLPKETLGASVTGLNGSNCSTTYF